MSNAITQIPSPLWNWPPESISNGGSLLGENEKDRLFVSEKTLSDLHSAGSVSVSSLSRFLPASSDSSITQEAERMLQHLSFQNVRIPEPDKVRHYLSAHPDMTGIAGAMASALREQFPSPTQISLDYFTSMEEDDKHLVIHVRQAPYQDDILSLIDAAARRFDERLASASGWIHPTTDFAPPKG